MIARGNNVGELVGIVDGDTLTGDSNRLELKTNGNLGAKSTHPHSSPKPIL